MYDMKIQTIAFVIIAFVLIDYFRNKRIPVKASACFSAFLITSAVCLFFDILSIITIYNIEKIDERINMVAPLAISNIY